MRYTPLIAVPLIVLSLAGCAAVQQEPPVATVAVEEQPLFASEEEALAAAQAAYTQYLAVSDQIARDGGANPERLEGLVTKSMYTSELGTQNSFAQRGIVMTGSMSADTLHLQAVTGKTVSMYLCLDSSGASLLNSKSQEVGTKTRWPLLVTLESTPAGELLLADSQTWSGTNFC
jgi:hypothetical protein